MYVKDETVDAQLFVSVSPMFISLAALLKTGPTFEVGVPHLSVALKVESFFGPSCFITSEELQTIVARLG